MGCASKWWEDRSNLSVNQFTYDASAFPEKEYNSTNDCFKQEVISAKSKIDAIPNPAFQNKYTDDIYMACMQFHKNIDSYDIGRPIPEEYGLNKKDCEQKRLYGASLMYDENKKTCHQPLKFNNIQSEVTLGPALRLGGLKHSAKYRVEWSSGCENSYVETREDKVYFKGKADDEHGLCFKLIPQDIFKTDSKGDRIAVFEKSTDPNSLDCKLAEDSMETLGGYTKEGTCYVPTGNWIDREFLATYHDTGYHVLPKIAVDPPTEGTLFGKVKDNRGVDENGLDTTCTTDAAEGKCDDIKVRETCMKSCVIHGSYVPTSADSIPTVHFPYNPKDVVMTMHFKKSPTKDNLDIYTSGNQEDSQGSVTFHRRVSSGEDKFSPIEDIKGVLYWSDKAKTETSEADTFEEEEFNWPQPPDKDKCKSWCGQLSREKGKREVCSWKKNCSKCSFCKK